jgi:hypothetical protein
MSWRSVLALLLLAFAGGAAGFAWLSTSGAAPWLGSTQPVASAETTVDAPEQPVAAANSFAVPTIVQPSASQAEALLLIQNVRRAIETGKPLGELGSRLQLTFGQTAPQALAIIANGARQPISNAELLARFDALAPQLALPVGTVWDRARYEFNTLFVLRSGDALPTASAARLAKIRRLIVAGDIAGAAKLVRTMPGAAAGSAWLNDAARAISVHQALDKLQGSAALPPPPPTEALVIPPTEIGAEKPVTSGATDAVADGE